MSPRDLVLSLLRKAVPDESEEQLQTHTLFSDGTLDSLTFLSVLAAVEEQIGTRVAEEDLVTENFDSLDAIDALLERYRNRSAPMASGWQHR